MKAFTVITLTVALLMALYLLATGCGHSECYPPETYLDAELSRCAGPVCWYDSPETEYILSVYDCFTDPVEVHDNTLD